MPTLRGASRLLGRFVDSPSPRRRLVVVCLVLIPWYRLALRKRSFRDLLSFSLYRRADESGDTRTPALASFLDGASPDDIGWAVDRVGSRFRIDGPCLTLALAALFLMSRLGFVADLRIGVARPRSDASQPTARESDTGPAQNIDAHAWLEYNGHILVGDLPDLDRYTPLPTFENVRL